MMSTAERFGLEPETEAEENNRIPNAARLDQRFKIPGDVIAKVCEELPEDQRAALKWFAGYCRDKNLSCEEAGLALMQPGTNKPYSGDSVYQAFTGRREDLGRFCQSVHVLRRRVEEVESRDSGLFVETSLAKKMFRGCDLARKKRRLVFMIADADPHGGDGTQIGKSRILTEYARRHNPGETHLVRMPTGGSLNAFLAEMALRLDISPSNRKTDLTRRIFESFDERMLLIIDEAELCVDGRVSAYETLDFIRELWDRRKCGVVIVGAINFRTWMVTHIKLRKLWKRAGGRAVKLPTVPSEADLEKFAKAFGLQPAPSKEIVVQFQRVDDDTDESVTEEIKGNPRELQDRVIRTAGLGVWISILEDAADMAKETGRKISWGHVLAVAGEEAL